VVVLAGCIIALAFSTWYYSVVLHPELWWDFQKNVLYAATPYEKIPEHIRSGRRPKAVDGNR
jgi:hypothetical protein